MAEINWAPIKAEYLSGNGSYRSLAKKYGVGTTRLGEVAKAEHWVAERKKARDKAVAKAVRANLDKEMSAIDYLGRAKELMAQQLAMAVAAVDVRDPQAVRSIVAAVKDAQAILGDRSQMDINEQQARIDKLRKEAEKTNGAEPETVEVVFAGAAADWSE